MNKTETFGEFSHSERLARLRLIRTDGIGPILFRNLIERYGSGTAALDALPSLLAKRKRGGSVATKDACERELEAAHRLGARTIFHGEALYPYRLAATGDAPPLLHTLGSHDLISPPASLGIVGARNASINGQKLTRMIAGAMADAAVTVISGLARGIDTAAHAASLEGGTVACVAGGLDVIYPRENTELFHKIAERGLVVSEMPPGTQPQARHFPRRNRIISGLSDGVLVVEAAERSGSLITARFALEQGRDVFAIPGSPLDARARGCNKLIKDGASLVQDAEDIFAELTPIKPDTPVIRIRTTTPTAETLPATDNGAPEAGGNILDFLSHTAVHVDEVIRISGMRADEVLVALMEHEIAGEITRHAGGKVSLA
ncbi:DNA-processing protein DprA [Kordiimonas gwangyangensis]|uniref:DNA-processing protein DprA n=1 Tax=Kordiimonas gwangyangensis TaxID=288022 RepID=UPI00037228F4|nr:DNA-processing protein DprA [Kordiimonas gwangyangensis]